MRTAILFTVALIPRLWVIMAAGHDPSLQHFYRGLDPWFYLQQAHEIARGHWLGTTVMGFPFYSYFLAALERLTGDVSLTLLRVVQAVLDAVSCLLIGRVASHFFTPQISQIAQLLAAFFGPMVFFVLLPMPTSLGLFLSLLFFALFLEWRARADMPRAWFWMALAAGLSCLTTAGMVLFTPFWAYGIAATLRRRPIPARRLAAGLAAGLLGLALTIGLAGWRNHRLTGQWIWLSAHGGMTFYMGNIPAGSDPSYVPPFATVSEQGLMNDFTREASRKSGRVLRPIEVSRYWYRRAGAFVLKHPRQWLKWTGVKILRLINQAEIPDIESYDYLRRKLPPLRAAFLGFGMIFALAVVAVRTRWSQGICRGPLVWVVAACAAAPVLYFAISRYRLPLAVFLIPWAAAGLWDIGRWVASRFGRSPVPIALGWGAAAWVISIWPMAVPGVSHAMQNEASVWLNLGELDRAERLTREVLRLDPDNVQAWVNRGAIAYQRGQWDQALRYFKFALARKPNHADAWFNAGMVYEKQQAYAQAEKAYFQAFRLQPRDSAALYRLGMVLHQTGRDDQARKALQAAVTLEPALANGVRKEMIEWQK